MRAVSLISLLIVAGFDQVLAGEVVGTNAHVVSPLLVAALIEEARTNHPALRAADLRADAALWNAASIREWDDPMAKLGVMGAERMRRADDGDLLYGVEQKLPLFGKPRAARAYAQSEAQTLRHEAAYRVQQLRRDLHRQLLKVALAERALDLSRTDVTWLETLVTSSEEKYRNGQATQQRVQFARVGRIAVGSLAVESPRVMIAPSQLEGADWGHDLNIGYGFMRGYVVTFEYPNKLITFERPAQANDAR